MLQFSRADNAFCTVLCSTSQLKNSPAVAWHSGRDFLWLGSVRRSHELISLCILFLYVLPREDGSVPRGLAFPCGARGDLTSRRAPSCALLVEPGVKTTTPPRSGRLPVLPTRNKTYPTPGSGGSGLRQESGGGLRPEGQGTLTLR